MNKSFLILSGIILLVFTGCAGSPLLPKEHIASISMPEENNKCMQCHDYILRSKASGGVKDLHRRHIESKKDDFDGSQKYCTICHEAWDEDLPNGIDREGVIHPATAQKPLQYWRRQVQKTERFMPETLYFINNENPYLFKPMLQRLVCLECHGPHSSIKELYHPVGQQGGVN